MAKPWHHNKSRQFENTFTSILVLCLINCSPSEYARNICCWTLSNNQSINQSINQWRVVTDLLSRSVSNESNLTEMIWYDPGPVFTKNVGLPMLWGKKRHITSEVECHFAYTHQLLYSLLCLFTIIMKKAKSYHHWQRKHKVHKK